MFDKILPIQVIGYLTLSRAFAYIGVAPLKIFIGELVLGAFAVFRSRDFIGRFGLFLTKASPLSGVSIGLLVLLLYGIGQTARGVMANYSAITAVQNMVLNYYPLYIFLGIWLAGRKPWLLRRLVLIGAWIHGVYGIAYILGLNKAHIMLPVGPGVELFSQPCGSTFFLLGCLCFPASRNVKVPAIVLNAITLIGIQARAEWLAFLVGLCIWGIANRRLVSLIRAFALLAVLMAVGFIADVKLPGAKDRGGDITARGIIGRVIAPIDKELAVEFNPSAKIYAGTVEWRTMWWTEIWRRVNDEPVTQVFGLSYGFPLSSLVPYLAGEEVRTPHNIFFYVLGYTGWAGVLIFFGFQAQLALVQWRASRISGHVFGPVVWAQTFTAGLFGNVFETPSWAIPTYIVLGMSAACLLWDQVTERVVFAVPDATAARRPQAPVYIPRQGAQSFR